MPDKYLSRKSIVPASRAPGASSVGIIRAIAAATVSRWWSSKNRSVMSSTSGRDGAAVVLGDRADEVVVRLIPLVLEAPATAGVLDVGTPVPAGEPRLAAYGVERGAVVLAAGRLARQPGPVRVELGRRPVADVGDDHGLTAGLLAPTGQVVAHPDPTLGRPLVGVGMEVVVVERQRGEREAVPVEEGSDLVGVEVLHVDVAGRERSVAEPRPGCHLEGLEPVLGCPGRDPVERAVGQARRQESQFHAGTSTQLCSAPAVTTAWVNTAARRPSMNVGRPSGFCPAIAAYTSETKALNASW